MPDDSSTRSRLMYDLKRRGPRTVRELATSLGVTTMAVRQRITLLEDEGVIASIADAHSGRGRPALRWKLTAAGHAEFPDAHAQVTVDLITSIREELGETALDTLIEKRSQDTRALYQAQLGKASDLAAKVHLLAELRSAEGYMAAVEPQPEGSFLLREDHCPICIAATACQGFCRSELAIFTSVLEGFATVRRDEHLLAGGRRCTYRIEPV